MKRHTYHKKPHSQAGFGLVGGITALIVIVGLASTAMIENMTKAQRATASITQRSITASTLAQAANTITRESDLTTFGVFRAKPGVSAEKISRDSISRERRSVAAIAPTLGSFRDGYRNDLGVCVFINGSETYTEPTPRDLGGQRPVYVRLNESINTRGEMENAPAYVVLSRGKNGQFDLNCTDFYRTEGSVQTMRKASEIQDMGYDDQFVMSNIKEAGERRSQNLANLMYNDQQCDPATEKLVYARNSTGQVEFQCVPEIDSLISGTHTGSASSQRILEHDVAQSDSPKDFRIKGLTAANSVKLNSTATDVQIVGPEFLVAGGAGQGLIDRIDNSGASTQVIFRKLVAGSNVSLTQGANNSIVISAASGGGPVTPPPASLWTQTGEHIVNANSGNVGIGGVPSGSYKLDVSGNSRISGNLNMTGNIIGSQFQIYNGGNAFLMRQSGAPQHAFYARSDGYTSVNASGSSPISLTLNNLWDSTPNYNTNVILRSNGLWIRDNLNVRGFSNLEGGLNIGGNLVINGTLTINQPGPRGGIALDMGGDRISIGQLQIMGTPGTGQNTSEVLLLTKPNNGIANRLSVWNATGGTGSRADLAVGTLFANNVDTSSDVRLKDNIKTLDTMLDKLMQIRAVSYIWKDGTDAAKAEGDNRQTHMGVIAQEIEKIFPDLVKTDSDKFAQKSVDYLGLIAPLIKSVQELHEENVKLSAANTELSKKLAAETTDLKRELMLQRQAMQDMQRTLVKLQTEQKSAPRLQDASLQE